MYSKLILACLLCGILAVAHADPGSEQVVRQFFRNMVTNNLKPELTAGIKKALRQYISERSLLKLGATDRSLVVDTLSFDRFDIIGSFGPYVEVRAHNWVCASQPTCRFPYYTVRIRTTRELGKIKIVPSNILSSKYVSQKFIQWHWVILNNNYEGQAKVQLQTHRQNANSRKYIDFVNKFFSLLTTDKFKKTSTAEKLRYIDPQFLIDINVHPKNVHFPQYFFKKYKIIDAFDHYVDVSVDISACKKAGNCFGQHVYRIKVKDTSNKLSIVPSGLNARFMNIEYWWTSIKGHYETPKGLSKYF